MATVQLIVVADVFGRRTQTLLLSLSQCCGEWGNNALLEFSVFQVGSNASSNALKALTAFPLSVRFASGCIFLVLLFDSYKRASP